MHRALVEDACASCSLGGSEEMATTAPPPAEQNPPWHTLSVDEAVHTQGADAASGLTPEEASKRFEQYGPNRFAAAPREPGWHAFLRQYRDPMQLVLVVAGLISALALRQWGTAL